jgi:hypothetical protein
MAATQLAHEAKNPLLDSLKMERPLTMSPSAINHVETEVDEDAGLSRLG